MFCLFDDFSLILAIQILNFMLRILSITGIILPQSVNFKYKP